VDVSYLSDKIRNPDYVEALHGHLAVDDAMSPRPFDMPTATAIAS
jgi:hypothetical protein